MNKNNKRKTRIILVRHGECKGNREGLFRGRSDFPLNGHGLIQAKKLASEMKPFKPIKVFTSMLSRAKETADIIGRECDVAVEICEKINNIDLGPWEGLTKDFISSTYPEQWGIWLTEPERLSVAGVESLDRVQERAKRGLEEIIDHYSGETVVMVSHRAVLKPLIASCLDIGKPYFWRIHMDTAAYSILHFEPERGFILVQLNQNKHLGEYISEWE